jgi:hypothetical protein
MPSASRWSLSQLLQALGQILRVHPNAGYETKLPAKYLCKGGEDNWQDYK